MRQLRERWRRGEDTFHVGDGLAVLDPGTAQRINADNFHDAELPDRLVDLLRFRRSPPVPWKKVRAAWAGPLKKLVGAEHVAALDRRLHRLTEERRDRPSDLTRALQEIFTRALVPTVIADLSPRQGRWVLAEQDYKLGRLMRPTPRKETAGELLRSAVLQIRVGLVARWILRGRAHGHRPRRLDLADPLVDLLPELGMDRASNAVTSVLTAIAGPPGAVAACMLLEIARRPRWARRMAAEQESIPNARFYAAPRKAAPRTHRFVRECLRVWSSPLILTRVARRPLCAGDVHLPAGDRFHLSPYFAHHDRRQWEDPESFDPERWRAAEDRGPRRPCAYAPFGYAPTSCIGAHLGLVELMLLCRLFTLRYKLEVEAIEEVEMVMASVPLPVGFQGAIIRR